MGTEKNQRLSNLADIIPGSSRPAPAVEGVSRSDDLQHQQYQQQQQQVGTYGRSRGPVGGGEE